MTHRKGLTRSHHRHRTSSSSSSSSSSSPLLFVILNASGRRDYESELRPGS
eukprot:CAMPEP_0198448414 /NCGR_PEP_ID=MMETSP1453-20131121/3408_1 /TAXON_ID=1461543 ORGANISM="Unidentified sp., Strain RCC701" /NCGR_SAMPLE_ID=MMETSP1453 /ASSEMBLY_ACC=CAM_ASM_001118 /LENGTH=50 /DNA_ID=CAMNT_0044170841 /DNA_START=54 /DNA_END=203 /DNA_ORIENTATION=+